MAFFRSLRKSSVCLQQICTRPITQSTSKGCALLQQIQPKKNEVPDHRASERGDMGLPNPLHHPDFFDVNRLVSIKELFDARVHYGHTQGTLNEHMKQFVFGQRLGTLIFDLNETADLLKQALNFIAHIAFRDGIIMFVSRYKQHTYIVEKTAIECKEFCHTRNWTSGTFTEPKFFGMMTRLPDLVIFLNTLDNLFEIHRGVIEASKLLIPSVAVVDTNCFPNYITYPIPGNDDSLVSIELYLRLFKLAILKGKRKREEYIAKYGDNFLSRLQE